MSLLRLVVSKCVPSMEDAQIIDELDITFLEIEPQGEAGCEEVESVESFGLAFGDGRDTWRAREPLEAREVAPGVLDDYAVLVVVQQRAGGVPLWRLPKSAVATQSILLSTGVKV